LAYAAAILFKVMISAIWKSVNLTGFIAIVLLYVVLLLLCCFM